MNHRVSLYFIKQSWRSFKTKLNSSTESEINRSTVDLKPSPMNSISKSGTRKESSVNQPMTKTFPSRPYFPKGLAKGHSTLGSSKRNDKKSGSESLHDSSALVMDPTEESAIKKPKFKKDSLIDREKRMKELERKASVPPPSSKNKKSPPKKIPKDVYLHDGISIANLSTLIQVPFDKLVLKMKKLGFETLASNHILDSETASLIVMEYNMNPIVSAKAVTDLRSAPQDPSNLTHRPPVVTIFGHVDHGKTTLLDAIRQSAVAANEAGGITQHIGAFSVPIPLKNSTVTFLDTPGHAAFSSMRKRGAQVTDIAVLVVAADDGIMPQTIEAIQHAKQAQIPIIVAINKMDKHHAKADKIKQALLEHDVVIEEFGGPVQCVGISALKGTGLNELIDCILLQADIMECKAEKTGPVEGYILESKVVRGRGNVATVLIKRGSLESGHVLVAGESWCKVRQMTNEKGKSVSLVGPSMPVEVVGWKTLPEAGDLVLQAKDENLAKKVIESRQEQLSIRKRLESISDLNKQRESEKQTECEPSQGEKTNQLPKFKVILKSDVDGSREALCDAILGLPCHQVIVETIHSGVGPVTESDLELARTFKACIYTFNVPLEKKIRALSESQKINIKEHSIIYHMLDDIKEEMSRLLPKIQKTSIKGEAVVLALFELRGKNAQVIAGSKLNSGAIVKSNKIKILRGQDKEIVYDGPVSTLKHFKNDVNEIGTKGQEFGIGFGTFRPQVGDVIQSYLIEEKIQKIH